MKRPVFFLLLLVPFLLVFIIKPLNYFWLVAVIYIWTIQTIRLRYIGVEWRDIAIAFTPFGFKYWMMMWEKDPASMQ